MEGKAKYKSKQRRIEADIFSIYLLHVIIFFINFVYVPLGYEDI